MSQFKIPKSPKVINLEVVNGKSTMNVLFEDGRIINVDTNLISFAKLASAGVPLKSMGAFVSELAKRGAA